MRPSVASNSTPGHSRSEFASDVAYYLTRTPRQLPSRYFYDALGSALFDAICHLPWYRITRAEQRLLAAHGPEILAHLAPLSTLLELGPGSGEKLATLVRAMRPGRGLTLHLIDVSRNALQRAGNNVRDLEGVTLVAHEASYEAGLEAFAREARSSGRTLALFLGSNIGNFDPPGADALLVTIRAALANGDALLLGTDLIKPERDLLLAYDDPIGVTAAFNRNLLLHVNRELEGDFDVAAFAHRALWNDAASRVEMHLISARRQRVRIRAAELDLAFEPAETIWTESSYKYEPGQVMATLGRAGFSPVGQWIDEEDRFALTLAEAV